MKQAIKHLNTLDSTKKDFLFACYDYRKKLKPRVYYGTFNKTKANLKADNEKGYCVYVTVNETDGTFNEKNVPNRSKENIKRCRAVWVEDDEVREVPRDDFPLHPSLIVRSSQNKYHYYWMTSTVDFPQWESVMMSMVKNWGCDPNARDISRVLRLAGFTHNKNVKMPVLAEIEECEGTIYEWKDIVKKFGTEKAAKTKKKKGKSNGADVEVMEDFDQDQAVQLIQSSKNYHNSLASIALSMSNKGLDRDMQLFALKGIMFSVPKNKRREEWEARMSDEHLYECIDSALDKVEGEKSEDSVNVNELELNEAQASLNFNIKYPPNEMGELCREIYEMAPHPNKIIAIAAGMGLIAGICGRRYNVSGMGLNLYITILGDSGIGKANLKDSINIALRGHGPMNPGPLFCGYSRFTGPKAMFDMLAEGMSRISVMEEAGLLSESKAGDTAGVSRALLDLYTSSGYGKYAGNEGYSSKESSIPVLHSPALSVVSISTPKSFLASMKSKSAELSGELARMWMMRSVEDKKPFNKNKRQNFEKETRESLKELIKICAKMQSKDEDLNVVNMDIPDFCYKDSDKWVKLENEYKHAGDHLRRTLCSRAWAKILKMSAVCSVYNGLTEIGEEEYKWAESCVNEELKFIQNTFTYESTDDMDIVIRGVAYPTITKILQRKFKTTKLNTSEQLSKRGIFTHTNITQALRNHSTVKELDDPTTRPNPKTGVEKVLEYMTRVGYLVRVDKKELRANHSKSNSGFKITDDFKLLGDEL